MNQALPGGPLAQAIGWALLHLLWQGAVVAALVAVLLPRLASRSANLRYAVSCAALLLIVALGVVTAFRSYPLDAASPATAGSPPATALASAEPRLPALVIGAMLNTPPKRMSTYLRTASEMLPAVVLLWLVGVAVLSLRLILEWQRLRGIVSRTTTPAREALQGVAQRLGHALGVRHAVRLLESAAVDVPSVVGLIRPAILLPASTLAGLTPAQLEMILAHELAHIRRHDFLVNLMQSVVETLLFYHPAVWWISRQVRIERENCCDDMAVELCGNPVHYARALARLEELRPSRLPLAVSATGGSLLERVRRLVTASAGPSRSAVRGASAVAVLSSLMLAIAAQSFSAIGVRKPSEAASASTAPRTYTSAITTQSTSTRTTTHQGTVPASDALPESDAVAPEDAAVAASETDATAEADDAAAAEAPAAKPRADAKPTLEELIALRTQNVTPEMIREMRTLFPNVELMEIATMSAVGVTPGYVREMRQLGLDVSSATDAQGLAAVGVTQEYVRAMRDVGFPLKSADEAQGLRAVGVTPAYVRSMRDVGFPLRSASDAQGLMAVGVTPEYVRQMREAGVKLENPSEVQSMAALGVTPDFVRRLAAAGYPNLSASQLNRLAAAGVTGDFIREMSKYRSQ